MDQATATPAPVIALLASAGGLQAVARVLRGLPANFPAAIIVLIHQAPGRPSALPQIFARACELPVEMAQSGQTLRRGEVLVIGPGQHLLIGRDRRVLSIEAGPPPPNRPSGDLLLVTLATALGSQAIAVVLSGGGHDGATGATAINACGGTVIATDEASSMMFSMPRATIRRDDAVDHVVALDDVADLLVELTAASVG
ncbi:MAG: two-component system, chemotaxis family, protein-glutamate methylesterase/glutaminase [Solirubrobacteraceae bacterium]|jgi:two-component system chemotaxis response regulator CheB|nr:two-component system, chemotaxis family, protein-glutamate methylesterase/glutaminase [Solirubrobacteraceae bacterium]